jgi:two-component system alkaline phosphatase synthesis response regulator PhoP
MTKILVADDDPIFLGFTRSLLEDRGYIVVTAEDGESALAAVRREMPDLVVTDLVMPFRNGLEIIREMRADESLKRIPVIVISMKDKEVDIVHGLEEGADDYVIKPVHALELAARIKKLLARKEARRP